MRIAIMQPYFIPYAGYFRLFKATDLFVIYDCVQFPRRGWVHRNQLPNKLGKLSWLTLPLVKMPQDVLISELAFPADASDRMNEQLEKFSLFKTSSYLNSDLAKIMMDFSSLSPTNYLIKMLKEICHLLQLPFNITQSSALKLSPDLKGQDRIIAIAKHFKAKEYINSPGGRELYDINSFKEWGLELHFLPDYEGSRHSILSRLFNEDIDALRNEISRISL